MSQKWIYLSGSISFQCGGELKFPDFLFSFFFFSFNFKFIRTSNMLYLRSCLKPEYLFLPTTEFLNIMPILSKLDYQRIIQIMFKVSLYKMVTVRKTLLACQSIRSVFWQLGHPVCCLGKEILCISTFYSCRK